MHRTDFTVSIVDYVLRMQDLDFYTKILGVQSPWRVSGVDVDVATTTVTVTIEHRDELVLRCPKCAASVPGYDHFTRRWRHLDTCQFMTVVKCSIPRVKCAEHGVVRMRVPWAEGNSNFTLLAEAHVIDWLSEASIQGVSRRLRMTWGKVDTIMARAVTRGMARRGPISTTRIAVDEKARAKGQKYVTVVVDQEKNGRVLHVADGRTKEALASFYTRIGPDACAKIEVVTMDMGQAYIEATKDHVPGAESKIAFDRFHVAGHIGNAVNQVRRAENRDLVAAGDDRLKRSRYLWLKNPENQTAKNLARFKKLERTSLRTAKAWRLKEIARFLWNKRPRFDAYVEWTAWFMKAAKTNFEPMRRVAETIRKHLWGIANAITLGVSNAKAESFNAAIQKLSSRAHGFRNNSRFANAIYFHLGGLDLYPAGITRR